MPKKQRQLARDSAILAKFIAGDVRVIDKIALDKPKTKQMVGVYKALGLDRTVLFALPGKVHWAGVPSAP